MFTVSQHQMLYFFLFLTHSARFEVSGVCTHHLGAQCHFSVTWGFFFFQLFSHAGPMKFILCTFSPESHV